MPNQVPSEVTPDLQAKFDEHGFDPSNLARYCAECDGTIGTDVYVFAFAGTNLQFCSRPHMIGWARKHVKGFTA